MFERSDNWCFFKLIFCDWAQGDSKRQRLIVPVVAEAFVTDTHTFARAPAVVDRCQCFLKTGVFFLQTVFDLSPL